MLAWNLVLPALLVPSVSGAASSPFPLDLLYQFLAGQRSSIDPTTIPSQCTSRCNLVVTTVNSCQNSTDPTCGCSLAIESGYIDCLNCLIALNPSQTLITTEQQDVDQFVAVCNSYGASLPSTSLAPVAVVSTPSGTTTLTSPTGLASSMTASSVVSQSTVTSLSVPTAPSSSGTSLGSGSSSSSSPPATTTRSAASRGKGNSSKSVAITAFAVAMFMLFETRTI